MNKKILALLLVLLMLVLCACTAAPESNDTRSGTTVATTEGGSGLTDSVFDETGNNTGDDKSFSASVPVTSKDPVQDPTDPNGETVVTEAPTAPTDDQGNPDTTMTYEEFNALSAAERRAYQESFNDIEAFFDWYDAAKAKYEEENPPIEIGGGTVTLPT